MALSMLVFNFPIENIGEAVVSKIRERNIIDKVYIAQQKSNVVDNFRMGIKEAQAATDPAELEYYISIGPIAGNTAATYTYASFFNPSGSGRTAVIKRIFIQSNANAAATFQDLNIRRITTASAGTAIAASEIPKKNAASVNSIMDVRTANPTVTLVGTNNARMMAVVAAAAVGAVYGTKDIIFDSDDEKIILQPGEGIALTQTAAGSATQRIRLSLEWDEQTSPPATQGEYMLAYPRVENAAAVDYKYATFFNPAASGKTAVVKRLSVDVDADTTAVYTNNIYVRRITAASAGTAITASDIMKKHSGSAVSAMDARYLGVTATLAGTGNSQIMAVNPAGAASQPHGHYAIDFASSDEKLVLQPGEGITLVSSATGDLDQLVRLSMEWDEETVAPSSQGEYMISLGPVSGTGVAGYNYASFFNPVASGKTAVVKRVAVRINAVAAATYVPVYAQRIIAASVGTQIPVADVPKKHTGTANSIMDIRTTNPTVTLAGTDGIAALMEATSAGAVAQLIGQKEIVFDSNEKLVLQPGQGIVLRQATLDDLDHRVRLLVEWDEETAAPSSQGEYLYTAGPVSGSTSANYNYASFFNPAASGKTAILKRVALRIDAVAAAVYISATLRRTTAASGGTLVAAADLTKKHTGTANSVVELRHTIGTTGVTYDGTADSRLTSIRTPGAAGAATAPQLSGYYDMIFKSDERIILQPGQGIALYQEAAGDADFRVRLLVEWDEEASAPSSQGEYFISSPAVTGSLNANYVYSTLFNPSGSGKDYVVKRIAVNAVRTGTLVAPGYIALTTRRITAASAGTQIAAANIPKKHTGTAASTAELRYNGVTATLDGTANSRFIGVTTPGAVGQISGIYESVIVFQDELILSAGQGLALFQESTAGDALMQFFFKIEWSEVTPTTATLTIGATSGPKVTNLNSGDTSQYINSTSCAGTASCAAFTLSLSSGSVTLTSIKITETGTVDVTNNLANLALFYDTDGNYSNGVTGQYGSTVAGFTAEAATVSGSLVISTGSTYYFFVRSDLAKTGTYPKGGQGIDFQVAANGDVTFTGTATATGAPVSLASAVSTCATASQTCVKPNATSITYGSGLADGGRSGESITVSGYGFGVAVAGANRSNCAGAVDTGCARFIAGGTATVANTDIAAWSNTSITFTINSSLASNGGASALEVVAGSQNDSTALTFYIYPNVTGMATCATGGDRDSACGTNASLEYAAADTFGLIQLNGDHFSNTAGTVQFTGGFGAIAGTVHATSEGACTVGGWAATSVCAEVNSTISDTVYDGTVTLTRNGDSKTDTIDLHILPRIASNTPTAGVIGNVITIDGDHFCQTSTCPGLPPTADYKVLFGLTEAISSDFVATGNCVAQAVSWSNTRICVKVPAGASTGTQKTKIVGKVSPLYESQRKDFTVQSTVPNNPDVGPGAGKGQFKLDETTAISIGGTTNESAVVFRADISASMAINMALQVEVKLVGTAFACGAGNCADAVEGTVVGGGACNSCTSLAGAKISVTGLSDTGKHWQARARNTTTNEYSSWVSFGGNLETGNDFIVDTTAPIITFPAAGNCSDALSGLTTNGVTITWNLNESADGQVEYSKNFDLSGSTLYPVPVDLAGVSHAIALKNLDSGTLYYFKVKSRDSVNNLAVKPPSSPYCSFTTASVSKPAKTTSFYITGKTSTIAAAAVDSTNFSVLVPENSPVVKSAFVEITGITNNPGTNNVQVQVNSQTAKTYAIDAASKSHFKIIYEITSGNLNLNDTPSTNTLSITPSLDTYIASAKVAVSYAYTP